MVTRQEFLLKQIASHREFRKVESITSDTRDIARHDGMIFRYSYNRKGDFILNVTLDGIALLNGSLSQVEEAIERGYTIKERDNG